MSNPHPVGEPPEAPLSGDDGDGEPAGDAEANLGDEEKLIGSHSFDDGPLLKKKHKSETATLRRKLRPKKLSSKNLLLLETKHKSDAASLKEKLKPKKLSSKNLLRKPMSKLKKSAQAQFENRISKYQPASGE